MEAAPTAPLSPVIPENASEQGRAAALTAQARSGDIRFREGLNDARGAVTRGAGASPGSENWVQAQEALSRADALRTSVTESLADLDALQIAGAQSGMGVDTNAAFTSAIADVGTIDATEREAIRALESQLSAP